MNEKVITFLEAISDSSNKYKKRHLLLGNGFSIDCCPDIFHYQSLYDEADFSNFSNAKEVFEALKIYDFEYVIKFLENSAKILPVYVKENATNLSHNILDDARKIKDILIQTIVNKHPKTPSDIADEKFWACRKFLNYFLGDGNEGHVFTLNYDLLLYWALLHDDVSFNETLPNLKVNDGFGNAENNPDAEYVVWQGESNNLARVYFLHGALHIFDAGSDLRKYTWNRKRVPLVTQAREAIDKNLFPVFVAEGNSEQKKSKIRHNAYLFQGLKVFTQNAKQQKHCFFILGHSLDGNDDHVLRQIEKGKCSEIYIGLFGEPTSQNNKKIISKAQDIASHRETSCPLKVSFFDSKSANIWGGYKE